MPYQAGDATCACNGALACRRHNRCKINTGWSYRMDSDGTFVWTTATGHSYRTAATDRWQTSADEDRPDPFEPTDPPDPPY